ncbi:MAG: tetratricopeptide repeat protein [Candidatus Thorarchaeota archaeon]
MAESNNELILKAKGLAARELFEESLEILEKLYKYEPSSEHIEEALIDVLLKYGGYLNDEYVLQYEKAEQMFKKVIEIDPTNYRAHYNLGIVHFNLERHEKAKECYEKAIELKPDYYHCIYNLGLIYEREGDLKEALKYYEKALDIEPNFPYAIGARNHILSSLKELQRIEKLKQNQSKFEKLKSLLEISKRVKIEMIRSILNLDEDDLITLLIEWGKKYKFELDGEYLNVNKETLPELFKKLESLEHID